MGKPKQYTCLPTLAQVVSNEGMFLATLSSSRSLVVRWSVRRSVGGSVMFVKK